MSGITDPFIAPQKEKPADFSAGFFKLIPGNDLLSRTVTSTVPLALRGLTSVFGMGTGVSPSVISPENFVFEVKLNTRLSKDLRKLQTT